MQWNAEKLLVTIDSRSKRAQVTVGKTAGKTSEMTRGD
jgi:hypothetical protein